MGITAFDKDPREILDVSQNAGDAEIRAAYLRKVKENPPDRSPAAFERVRDAYEILRDPRRRALYMFLSVDPAAPLASLLPPDASERRYTGPGPWLAALKENR
jgi:DnaJ-domain-containing protein 1